MTLFEKVKVAVYASSCHKPTKKDSTFVSWANAWLLGEDRSPSGCDHAASRHRSPGSLSAKAANAFSRAKEEDNPVLAAAHRKASDRWAEESLCLLGYNEEGREKLVKESSCYPDDIVGVEAPEGYRGYVNKIPNRMSNEEWERKLDEQNHCCAVCKKHRTACFKFIQSQQKKGFGLVKNHDHETGKILGLLCVTCNLGLANFKRNPAILENAIEYLQKCAAEKLITS